MAKRKAEPTELKQTKGSFRLVGKVSRLDDNEKNPSFREAEGKEGGKMEGIPYRSLRFSVITNDADGVKNEVPVEMFNFEQEEVYVWNRETKKTRKVPIDEIQNLDEDDMMIGTRVGLIEKNEENEIIGDRDKIEAENMPTFEAILAIYENLENGDDVYINGQIEHSVYVNDKGTAINQTRYKIDTIGTPKREINFDDPKFVEKAHFEDEFVFVDMQVDKKAKSAFIQGKSIDYKKDLAPVEYRIDFSQDHLAEEEDKLEDFATGLASEAKFGDVFAVWGRITNAPQVTNVVDEKMARLGVRKMKPTMQSVAKYLDIIGLDAGTEKKPKEFWIQGMYTEDDLYTPPTEDEKPVESRFLRNAKKPKPAFEADEDNDAIDIDSDTLPF